MVTNNGSLEVIILYNALCTMHAGATMHSKPCYKLKQNPMVTAYILWLHIFDDTSPDDLAWNSNQWIAGVKPVKFSQHSHHTVGMVWHAYTKMQETRADLLSKNIKKRGISRQSNSYATTNHVTSLQSAHRWKTCGFWNMCSVSVFCLLFNTLNSESATLTLGIHEPDSQ